MNLVRRCRQAEWMDEEGLDQKLHSTALDGLRRINWYSRSSAALWGAIRQAASSLPKGRVRVLDVGCGGGDLVVGLHQRASSSGRAFLFAGCDVSPFAVEYARRHATSSGADKAEFFEHDVVAAPLPDDYDFVVCSLFLHHFGEGDAVAVLSRMNAAARHGVIVQDLRRTRIGYMMAWAGCRALSRSPVVHTDGPLSVEGAFTAEEAHSLAERAGLSRIQIQHCWPQRFILSAVSESP